MLRETVPIVDNKLPEAREYLDEIYQNESIPDEINSRIDFLIKRTGMTYFHSKGLGLSLDSANYQKADEEARKRFLNSLERCVISEETCIRRLVGMD